MPAHDVAHVLGRLEDRLHAVLQIDVPVVAVGHGPVGVLLWVLGLGPFGNLLPDGAVVHSAGGLVESPGDAVASTGVSRCRVFPGGQPVFPRLVGAVVLQLRVFGVVVCGAFHDSLSWPLGATAAASLMVSRTSGLT